jgi:hypothetical protein
VVNISTQGCLFERKSEQIDQDKAGREILLNMTNSGRTFVEEVPKPIRVGDNALIRFKMERAFAVRAEIRYAPAREDGRLPLGMRFENPDPEAIKEIGRRIESLFPRL